MVVTVYQGLLNGASIINLRVGPRWPDGISSLEEKLSSDNVRCGRGCYTTNQYKVYSGIGIACIGFITGAGG